MHYADAGPKDAQRSPVVLVHRAPVSSLVYRRLTARLATARRVAVCGSSIWTTPEPRYCFSGDGARNSLGTSVRPRCL